MKKMRILYLSVVMFILMISMAFIGMDFMQAQTQVKARPPEKGKPKPPEPGYECNYNGNCEWEDYQAANCPDCDPKIYMPLVIDVCPQIVTSKDNIIYQYKYSFADGKYHDIWASVQLYEKDKQTVSKDLVEKSVSVGDVDNDGEKEIIALIKYNAGRSKGQNLYDHKLALFENNSEGAPSWESPYLGVCQSQSGRGDCAIADADNDGINEVVVAIGKHIEIKRIIYDANSQTYDFIPVWESHDYDQVVWEIDVGDADNDSKNEIVLGLLFSPGAPVIWELNADNIWEETIGEPVNTGAIDVAVVRDSDTDGLYEIVAGGNNNKLMIWKYIDGVYRSVFVSGDLGGYTQGVDAGDIDGDGENEIVIASSYDHDALYIFKYVEGNYMLVNSILQDGPNIGLSIEDLDLDERGEIVSSTHGITVYEFDDYSSALVKIFNCYYGSDHEID
jgi:hypothetical protein